MGSTVAKLWNSTYDYYRTPCEKEVHLDKEFGESDADDEDDEEILKDMNNNQNNINFANEDTKDEIHLETTDNAPKKEATVKQENSKETAQQEVIMELSEPATPKETEVQQTIEIDSNESQNSNNSDNKIEIENELKSDMKMELEEEKSEDSNNSDNDSSLSSDFEFDNSFDDVEYSGSEDDENKVETEDKRQTYTQAIQPAINEDFIDFNFQRIKIENDNRPVREILQEYIDTNLWRKEWIQLSKELLLVDLDHCTSVAKMTENKNKSNYSQFFTFDDSRVHLRKKYEKSGKEKIGSDYVNASLIYLPEANCQYIAAGAPSEDSISDFWRMIWEKDCKYVVMLTKLVEGGRMKSAQYWPSPVFLDSDEEDDDIFDFTDDDDFVLSEGVYGNFTVQLKYQNTGDIHKDITQRTFKVLKDACKYENEEECESKMVTQFHYCGWPDHGVPDDVEGVCSLVKKIYSFYPGNAEDNDNNNNDNNNDKDTGSDNNNDDDQECDNKKSLNGINDEYNNEKSNVVVHCSAGIGRTGTFLVIHSELTKYLKAKSKGDVFNIFETVRSLRKQRYYMIQTEEQYLFCYKSLLQLIDSS